MYVDWPGLSLLTYIISVIFSWYDFYTVIYLNIQTVMLKWTVGRGGLATNAIAF